MKSLLEITSHVLQDCSAVCGVNPNRDLLEITRRVENEGESFLTITLPTLASGLEKALDQGFWSPALSTAFSCGRKRSLPRFLGGFFDQIFDGEGTLRQPQSVAVQCIWAIRQICRVVSKLYLPASPRRIAKALQRFVDVEQEVRTHVSAQSFTDAFKKVSAIVWSDILGSGGDSRRYLEYHPRHGRGTTAEAIVGNDKYHFRSWPLRLEREFPFSEFGISNVLNDEAYDSLSSLMYLLPRDETPVKVVPVPKTAKTPRIIAIEPVAMQYMQQAIADWVRPRIETRCRFTAGHVNFTDQLVNNQLARIGSKNGFYATLDLSDASDRVSCKHVATMLRCFPLFLREVMSCRSTRASLPGGTLPLRKFASMGSALCFPMEAMVFFIAIVTSKLLRRSRALSPRNVLNASRDVYVYGDDLIVSAYMAPSVVEDLELFGLKVNAAKSFWTGKFRESCGGDYYDGIDVVPVYCRRKLPDHRADVHGIVSAVAFANQLYWAGLWGAAKMVRQSVEKLVGPLPSVCTHDQILGWESFSNARSFQSWDYDLQRPKSRGYVIVPGRRSDILDGDSALLKCWRTIGRKFDDPTHLRTSVRYGNLALKRRWT
jgi:hypothetical protein